MQMRSALLTGGGTEANALALEGAGRAAYRAFQKLGMANPKLHLIISAIEHSSILETANMLEKQGVEVTRLPVDNNGLVSLEQLKKSIKPETFLVSIMTANNEIGTIQPIREIAKVIRDYKKGMARDARKTNKGDVEAKYPLFHTDACQAVLYEELNVEKLGIDLLTLDASKAYGSRGVGALFVKRGTPIEPIDLWWWTGKWIAIRHRKYSRNCRLCKSIEIIKNTELVKDDKKVVNFSDMEKEGQRVGDLRDYFEREIKKIRSDATINAANAPRVPHISNITFPGIDAEILVLRLDAKGIFTSTKSACLRDEDESYVLSAIGTDSKSSIRFSFGRWTKIVDIKRTLAVLRKFIQVQGLPLY